MKWKIGDVNIDNQVVLAPMAGICDSSFRTIVKSMGCGLLGCEMISANAIMYGSHKTDKLLYFNECERPISHQIFGNDVKALKIAAKYIYENFNVDIIDINMGCPVPKVAIRGGSGAALLKNKDKVYEIVNGVVDEVPIPITVKIRSGWDNVNAIEIAKIIENAGALAITIHPRTRNQGYSGKSDWNVIKEVKNVLNIPVIGNGDIKTCYGAKAMVDITGCDAVMIGRGVLGNPWLIKECVDYLDNGIIPCEVSIDEKIAMIKKHVNLLLNNLDEKVAIPKMRSQTAYYIKKEPNTIELKKQIFKANTKEELFKLLDDYLEFRKM